MEIKNAKITSVTLTMKDHGVLTFYLTLEGNGKSGMVTGYGGYVIGHGYLGANDFDGSGKGVEAIMRMMNTVGVDTWEDLKGKYLRYEDNGWGSCVTKIGHIIEDKWFDIKEFFDEAKKEYADLSRVKTFEEQTHLTDV